MHALYSSLAAVAPALVWALAACPAVVEAQQQCNGAAVLCDRPFSNVSFVGAHDSAFVGDLPTENQHIDASQVLGMGFRYLQAQTHKNVLGELDMCHTSCWELDAGSLVNYLGPIKTFLDANPNEVVNLLLVNGDFLDVGNFSAAFESAGLDKYAYAPGSNGAQPLDLASWPTLAELISAGTRLVAFLDYKADLSECPYILDEYSYYFETPYDTTDPTFPECTLDRPPGGNSTADSRMYIINHFLDLDILGIDVPDEMAAGTTNSATGSGSIESQAGLCEQKYGRWPNGVLLDYIDEGSALAAQSFFNGV